MEVGLCGSVNHVGWCVEKCHCMDRSGGHGGCGRRSCHGQQWRWNWAALTVKVVRLRIAPTTVEAAGSLKHVDNGGRGQVSGRIFSSEGVNCINGYGTASTRWPVGSDSFCASKSDTSIGSGSFTTSSFPPTADTNSPPFIPIFFLFFLSISIATIHTPNTIRLSWASISYRRWRVQRSSSSSCSSIRTSKFLI